MVMAVSWRVSRAGDLSDGHASQRVLVAFLVGYEPPVGGSVSVVGFHEKPQVRGVMPAEET
jgi:hypothetical protein